MASCEDGSLTKEISILSDLFDGETEYGCYGTINEENRM